MTEKRRVKVVFNDGTEFEVGDLEFVNSNRDGGFIVARTADKGWVFFIDRIKYLVWTPPPKSWVEKGPGWFQRLFQSPDTKYEE